MARSASACLALPPAPAPCLGSPADALAVGDYEVRLSGPGAGLWRKGARLGAPLLWQLGGSTPAELVEAATPAWQALCDAFNGK